jgi:hypothetical protein
MFKLIEFDELKSEAGTNRFTLSPQQWIKKTGAIGLYAKSGRYGGTYAHKDVAFEFAAWISPQFKLYLIKEFQRLKEEQNDKTNTEWNVRRILAATNYRIHTDAIKEGLIPWAYMSNKPDHLVYADEAELLNLALFGITSSQWKKQYPEDAAACKNLRDHADTTQLIVLSNLESMNAMLIRNGIKDAGKRFGILRNEALKQLESLNKITKSRSITGSRPNKQD